MLTQDTIIGNNNEFAKHSLLIRIPEILKAAANSLEKVKHAKETAAIYSLIDDLINNREIVPIKDDKSDNSIWNKRIQELKELKICPMTYLEAPWLFVECYIYRRLEGAVYKLNIDVFQIEKAKSLKHFLELYEEQPTLSTVKEQAFAKVLNSLWGNQMDLSLHVNMANMPVHVRNMDNLILNDFEHFWKYFNTIRGGIIHIVLDNVGAEFVNDLLLADFLVENGFAAQIVMHCKAFPYFVSDVTLHDVDVTFKQLALNKSFAHLAQKWTKWRGDVFEFKTSDFWTLSFVYADIELRDPILFAELSSAELVIFKGDLNYRKLTGDRISETALNDVKKIHALAIRTCKSDTLVGVENVQRSKLTAKDPKWAVNGKYGIIQYFYKARNPKRKLDD